MISKILLVGIVFAILGFPLLIAIVGRVSFQQLTTETITVIDPPAQVPVVSGTVLIDVAFDIDGHYVIFPFTTVSDGGDNLTVSFENFADTQVTVTLEELIASGYWSHIQSFTIFEHGDFVTMGRGHEASSTLVNYRNLVETSDEDLTDFRVRVESLSEPLAGALIVSQQENL